MNPADSVFFDHLRIAHKFCLQGVDMEVFDFLTSCTPGYISQDLQDDTLKFASLGLKPGDFVLDVGANIGMVSIFLAKKYGVHVLAVEPMPHNVNNLRENIKRNGVETQVGILPAALVDKQLHGGSVVLEQSPVNSGGASIHRLEKGFQCPKFTVQAVSLDFVLETLCPPKVKLVKMDIEGAEYEVLRSCTRWAQIENLAVELHRHGCFSDDVKREQIEFDSWLETKLPGRVKTLIDAV